MVEDRQTAFIIDEYSKYSDKDRVRSVFKINGKWWAIKEVFLKWGHPILDSIESDEYDYHIYSTFEEAQEYVRTIKSLEGAKL